MYIDIVGFYQLDIHIDFNVDELGSGTIAFKMPISVVVVESSSLERYDRCGLHDVTVHLWQLIVAVLNNQHVD